MSKRAHLAIGVAVGLVMGAAVSWAWFENRSQRTLEEFRLRAAVGQMFDAYSHLARLEQDKGEARAALEMELVRRVRLVERLTWQGLRFEDSVVIHPMSRNIAEYVGRRGLPPETADQVRLVASRLDSDLRDRVPNPRPLPR